MTQGDARRLGQGLLDVYSGQVALILTSPPYGPSLHGHIRKTPGKVVKYNARYSRNPDNLAQLPRARDKAAAAVVPHCARGDPRRLPADARP